ncbi:MAG: aspartate aminotransferase family protein [Candidatus Bathyarchaeia archaeon]|jgi:glutamate-1-semialdehyde 2,1-aminomutase
MSTIEKYLKMTKKSHEIHDRASKVFPSGITRAPFFMVPYHPFIKRAAGCKVWDVDGNEYLDYVCNMGPLILGHANPKIREAILKQVDSGFLTGGPSELEIELAEKVKARYSSVEKLQFCPSGTEACMFAMKAIRAYTEKEKVIATEGAFHGSSDSFTTNAGVPKCIQEQLIRVPFNDAEALEKKIKENRNNLAGVFIEPVLGRAGSLAPKDDYLKSVREITEKEDLPLVFDEVVTGFRLAPGGAAERYGVKPDVAIFGKILGGGFPCAAFGGTEEIMNVCAYPEGVSLDVAEPIITHPGTFNDHKIAMAAGAKTLDLLDSAAYEHLEKTGNRIRSELSRLSMELGIHVEVTGVSSMFHIHFTNTKIMDIRTAMKANSLLIRYYDMNMLIRGINLAKHHSNFCSTPLTEEDVNKTLKAVQDTLTAMKPTIRENSPNLVTC